MPAKQAESNQFLFINVSKTSGADKKAVSIPTAGRAFVRRNEWSSRRIRLRDAQSQLPNRSSPGQSARVAGSETYDSLKGGAGSRADKDPALCARPTSMPRSQGSNSTCANCGHHQALLFDNFHHQQAFICVSCQHDRSLGFNSRAPFNGRPNPFGNVSKALGPEGPTILRYCKQQVQHNRYVSRFLARF